MEMYILNNNRLAVARARYIEIKQDTPLEIAHV